MGKKASEQYRNDHAILTEMIKEGKGDSKEADDLRDKMDVVWYEMSPEEQDACRKDLEKTCDK